MQTEAMKRNGSETLDVDEAEAVRQMVLDWGEYAAAERLGVARYVCAKAAARLPMRKGSVALVRAALAVIEAQEGK